MLILPTHQMLMSAVFGAALAAAPTSQVVAQDPKTESTKQGDTAELKKQLDQIQNDVKNLQEFRKTIDDAVLGKIGATEPSDMGLLKRLADIETRMKRIEDSLNQISSRLDSPKSTSGFGGGPSTGTTAATGHVRIVNDYPTEMSMIVNGRSHRVPAGQSVTVDIPPGSFTYELLHAGSTPTTSSVKEGETMTLRIR